MKRRDFLRNSALVSGAFMIPAFLKPFEALAKSDLTGYKNLVIIQLSGGNDGLNTIIPYGNDIYYQKRKTIAINQPDIIKLNDMQGLNPSLSALKDIYDQGLMSIINSVGYPNPDRSHFRSMDIWQTASGSNEYRNTGWIGRWLDAQCDHCDKPTQALEIDDMLSLALSGDRMKGIALHDPARLYNASRDPFFRQILQSGNAHPAADSNNYLFQVMAETISGADYIFEQSKLHPSVAAYPDTEIGKSFKTIASLICSGINTRVYYLSLGSFDTHVNQEDRQQKLFVELNAAIQAFVSDLKSNHRFHEVMLMTFSEFGRRVAQNASGGTDHGTAS